MIELLTAADTRELGRRLSSLLQPGDLIVLTGPLGAGKTVLVQGIGIGLGVAGPVVSPTFVIARVHRGGRLPLVHVDAYRLGSVAEVDDLDLDATLAESVTVVEWGGGLVEQLAEAYLEIRLERAEDDRRTAELVPAGGSWPERLEAALPRVDPPALVDRDRDQAGRARNARPRDALGRPLPYGAAGVQRQPEGIQRSPHGALMEAQRLLDAGMPFHAHEVLEDAWKATDGPERALWRGLAQLAVGLTHAVRGNAAGAVALLRRGTDNIEPYGPTPPHGIDITGLAAWARSLAEELDSHPGTLRGAASAPRLCGTPLPPPDRT